MKFDKQKIFNKAYRGLARQGFRQSKMRDGVICAYRGLEDCKCFIGQIMPDNGYRKGLEGASASDDRVLRALGFEEASVKQVMFLLDGQDAHDGSSGPGSMKRRLASFAKRHNLAIPKVAA